MRQLLFQQVSNVADKRQSQRTVSRRSEVRANRMNKDIENRAVWCYYFYVLFVFYLCYQTRHSLPGLARYRL
jgi:hypothetical protein